MAFWKILAVALKQILVPPVTDALRFSHRQRYSPACRTPRISEKSSQVSNSGQVSTGITARQLPRRESVEMMACGSAAESVPSNYVHPL